MSASAVSPDQPNRGSEPIPGGAYPEQARFRQPVVQVRTALGMPSSRRDCQVRPSQSGDISRIADSCLDAWRTDSFKTGGR